MSQMDRSGTEDLGITARLMYGMYIVRAYYPLYGSSEEMQDMFRDQRLLVSGLVARALP